ncbi:MAG TPA: hypothetical protein VMZ30_22440 [Pyrinomonadaceae bacterium]|nr:hypothetical protein [Pyrinomonadaceae bacterium]
MSILSGLESKAEELRQATRSIKLTKEMELGDRSLLSRDQNRKRTGVSTPSSHHVVGTGIVVEYCLAIATAIPIKYFQPIFA